MSGKARKCQKKPEDVSRCRKMTAAGRSASPRLQLKPIEMPMDHLSFPLPSPHLYFSLSTTGYLQLSQGSFSSGANEGAKGNKPHKQCRSVAQISGGPSPTIPHSPLVAPPPDTLPLAVQGSTPVFEFQRRYFGFQSPSSCFLFIYFFLLLFSSESI